MAGASSGAEARGNIGKRRVRMLGEIGATPAIHEPAVDMRAVAMARVSVADRDEMLDIVHGLFTREVSVRQLGGPIAIARTSVAAAKTGLECLFR